MLPSPAPSPSPALRSASSPTPPSVAPVRAVPEPRPDAQAVDAAAGPIILFDGLCNVCAASVQFVIRHDPAARFRLAALQSDVGRALCAAYGVDAAVDSIVLIADGRAWDASDAALRIARGLRRPWPLAYALTAVPRPVRDAAYHAFARRRYRWFGRRATCLVPTAAIKARFLG